MEIIEDRHGKTSLIITSQLPVSKWHEVIGEKMIADAILDRIVHDAHRLELKGESMRKKRRPLLHQLAHGQTPAYAQRAGIFLPPGWLRNGFLISPTSKPRKAGSN